jgi:response regulator RpfG family c-di-GMP phosphodiesterase
METSAEEIVTVLVLAGDLDVAEWYRVKLELDGYQVRVVPRTLQPINLHEYPAPDLLVLDVRPVQRDAVAFNQVRSHPRLKDVPAILLSSQRPDKLSEAGFTLAPIDYIVAIPPAAPPVRIVPDRSRAAEPMRTPVRQLDWSYLDRPESPMRA